MKVFMHFPSEEPFIEIVDSEYQGVHTITSVKGTAYDTASGLRVTIATTAADAEDQVAMVDPKAYAEWQEARALKRLL